MCRASRDQGGGCFRKLRILKKATGPPEAGRGWGQALSHSPGRNQTLPHLDPRLPASRTARRYLSVVSGPRSVVLCYSGPGNRHVLDCVHRVDGDGDKLRCRGHCSDYFIFSAGEGLCYAFATRIATSFFINLDSSHLELTRTWLLEKFSSCLRREMPVSAGSGLRRGGVTPEMQNLRRSLPSGADSAQALSQTPCPLKRCPLGASLASPGPDPPACTWSQRARSRHEGCLDTDGDLSDYRRGLWGEASFP